MENNEIDEIVIDDDEGDDVGDEEYEGDEDEQQEEEIKEEEIQEEEDEEKDDENNEDDDENNIGGDLEDDIDSDAVDITEIIDNKPIAKKSKFRAFERKYVNILKKKNSRDNDKFSDICKGD